MRARRCRHNVQPTCNSSCHCRRRRGLATVRRKALTWYDELRICYVFPASLRWLDTVLTAKAARESILSAFPPLLDRNGGLRAFVDLPAGVWRADDGAALCCSFFLALPYCAKGNYAMGFVLDFETVAFPRDFGSSMFPAPTPVQRPRYYLLACLLPARNITVVRRGGRRPDMAHLGHESLDTHDKTATALSVSLFLASMCESI